MTIVTDIPFHYWTIMGLIFWLADLFKLGRIAKPLTFAAIGIGIVVFVVPGLYWGWQLSGFVALTALSAVYYFKKTMPQQASTGQSEPSRQRKAHEGAAAGNMIGTRVTLSSPLYPGSSKLEVNGRFWKVSGSRDFPAGSVVEVVGHHGNTLEVAGSAATRLSESVQPRGDTIPLSDYSRKDEVEWKYGKPDYDYWSLFRAAQTEHRKLSLINVYHVLSGLKGLNLEQAREQLNTHTLALYDDKRPGEYLNLQQQMYSQPRIYNFLYMNGRWTGREEAKFEAEINDLIAALHSDWAVKFRGDIRSETALRAVMMIRKQQVEAV